MDKNTAAHPTSEGIIFTISINSSKKECLISRDALNTLSRLKNIDSTDADSLELFTAFESFIRPVAQSLFAGEFSDAPCVLTPESMNAAYCSPFKFQQRREMPARPSSESHEGVEHLP